MGVAEFTSALSNVTDSDFREWVGAWLQGWEDAGWVRADDTGQIDPETVSAPTSAAMAGFAMFRFDDDLQATHPVYIKIEFGGRHVASGLKPGLQLTIGKATDGAGGVTSVLVSQGVGNYITNSANSATTTSFTHIASSGDGYVAFLAFIDDTNGDSTTLRPFSFIIERARGTDGQVSGDGLLVVIDSFDPGGAFTATGTRSLAGSPSQNIGGLAAVHAINYLTGALNLGGPPVSAPSLIQGAELAPTTSLAAGGIGPVLPWVLIAPGIAPWQSCCIVSIPAGDTPGGVFQTVLCGGEVQMRPVPASDLHSVWGITISPDPSSAASRFSRYFSPAIRWETD